MILLIYSSPLNMLTINLIPLGIRKCPKENLKNIMISGKSAKG
jgi:hypothetical protein